MPGRRGAEAGDWTPVLVAAALLLPSGYCALVYESTWLRSLRLVFGGSTPASAVVLACFMGGLGAGGLVLGRRADAARRPLLFYAGLEAGIALLAAASPFLVEAARWVYLDLGLGGVAQLGPLGANLVRGALAAVVLVPPAFLMGGTLPVLARAVEEASDRGRRLVGLLYAVNALGAVAGTLAATFLYVEAFGIRRTLWLAAATNLLVALAAAGASGVLPGRAPASAPARPARSAPAAEGAPGAPVAFVLLAAAIVGFVFFVMELVWYRMLAPLLGGSSYTLGLVLAVALLGIGAGGLLYAAGGRTRRPTLGTFAVTCALEALALALPYALGDRIAVLTIALRAWGELGFGHLVASWSLVTTLVVLPAAAVAGYQFPLLVAILGGGVRRVGQQVGAAYAWNTAGSIAGALAGGFWLVPWLGAPRLWTVAAGLLVALSLAAWVAGQTRLPGGEPAPRGQAAVALGLSALAALACLAPGPSAVWRHQPIGAGRVPVPADANGLAAMERRVRGSILWETDGLESSLAISSDAGYALLVNGKSDGHVRNDAATTIMMPLVGALLHSEAHDGLVIGPASGASAGWLAAVDSIETVDVVEIEPRVVHYAGLCGPLSLDALASPKVRLEIGDAREFLLTTPRRYDLVVSEPSNPYRAGVSSLLTREFYRAAADRLRTGGIFLQWLQAYEVDAGVVRTALATLAAVFPHVEIWEVKPGADLVLAASGEPIVHDLARMAARVETPPFRQGLAWTWGVAGVEGLHAGYVASEAFVQRTAEGGPRLLNTDDRPVLEFAFARLVGRVTEFRIDQLRRAARVRGEDRPATRNGTLDPVGVAEARAAWFAWDGLAAGSVRLPKGRREAASRIRAREAWANGELARALRHWREQPEAPEGHLDLLLVAEGLAEAGDPGALPLAARLEGISPVEASAVRAALALARQDVAAAGAHLVRVFEGLRERPWAHGAVVQRSERRALEVAGRDVETGRRLFEALGRPFSLLRFEQARHATRLELARQLDFPGLCREAIEPLEPHFPWDRRLLAWRRDCYRIHGDPRAPRAAVELATFSEQATDAWPMEQGGTASREEGPLSPPRTTR